MTKPPTTNIGLRVPVSLQQRIDAAAERNGQTRTEYILSWLPVYHERTAEPQQTGQQQGQRVARSRGQSSPTRT